MHRCRPGAPTCNDHYAWGITANLADRDSVRRVQKALAAEHADAKSLVSSAGVFIPKAFHEYRKTDYAAHLELARSGFFLAQTVSRGMIASDGGGIVSIGSMWAHQAIGVTRSTSYSMGKDALHALTHGLPQGLLCTRSVSTQ